ncbi:MAG TPA: hypothetical protein VNS58_11235 [Puia sp.]|nr:hypothetical protein [Puia sp.]
MSSLILKTGWACLLFLAFDQVSAQVFENNAGARERHFVYEVKQIDEFFERFNDDPNSFIRKEYDSYHRQFNLTREQLVRSLFNYETHSWDSTQLDEFVGTVINVNKPLLLDFYRQGWFAEANCKFEYNATVIEIPIILRIEADASKRSKWMIAAVKHNSMRQEVQVTVAADTMKKSKFINPASHASGFIELARAFEDRAHLSDYFEDGFFKRANSIGFYHALQKNQIRFIAVKDIKYHYLQIDQWIFTVENFQRKALNSGWLINHLKSATESDKQLYIKNLLEE